jgi:hypothetical protein
MAVKSLENNNNSNIAEAKPHSMLAVLATFYPDM